MRPGGGGAAGLIEGVGLGGGGEGGGGGWGGDLVGSDDGGVCSGGGAEDGEPAGRVGIMAGLASCVTQWLEHAPNLRIRLCGSRPLPGSLALPLLALPDLEAARLLLASTKRHISTAELGCDCRTLLTQEVRALLARLGAVAAGLHVFAIHEARHGRPVYAAPAAALHVQWALGSADAAAALRKTRSALPSRLMFECPPSAPNAFQFVVVGSLSPVHVLACHPAVRMLRGNPAAVMLAAALLRQGGGDEEGCGCTGSGEGKGGSGDVGGGGNG